MIDILTIGHSNMSWDEFHYGLDQFHVDCIIDVRSSPTSRWPQFRKQALQAALNRVGISYVHLGDNLGGHPKYGPTAYDERRGTSTFATGIKSVLSIANRCRPALMCAEGDALHCHRFLLIARHLHDLPGLSIWHIHRNGTLEEHTQTENRLLALHKLSKDLPPEREDRLAEAYVRQERRLG